MPFPVLMRLSEGRIDRCCGDRGRLCQREHQGFRGIRRARRVTSSDMADLLIIFHSQTGNTERLARAVARGVEETANARAHLKRAADTVAQDLRSCNALVICSAEYFGYMAGAIKDFFDRTYEELKDDVTVHKKSFSIVVSAGNDGSFALSHIERICKGYRLREVQKPIVCKGEVTEEVLARCFELGSTIAEGVNVGIF